MKDEARDALGILSKNLEDVVSELKSLRLIQEDQKKKQQKQGRVLIITVACVGLIIPIIVAFFIVSVSQNERSNTLSDVQQKIHDSQMTECSIINQKSTVQKELFEGIIKSSGEVVQKVFTPAQIKAQEKLFSEITPEINNAYAQLDCNQLFSVSLGK